MQRVRDFLEETLDSVADRTGLALPAGSPTLLDELTRLFLSGVVDDRASFLARKGNQPVHGFRPHVFEEYAQRLQAAIGDRTRALRSTLNPQRLGRTLASLEVLGRDLDQLFLPQPVSAGAFQTLQGFARLMRSARADVSWRGGLWPGPLWRGNARILASAVLGAAQRVVLDIIRDDYSSAARPAEVPPEAMAAIQKVLSELDRMATALAPIPPIKPLPQVDTELRVAMARAAGRVWLPLRPIPTSPLPGAALDKYYSGRRDELARRLARQIRHADGSILVTGYRGVGKSSFVNRVIHHALAAQSQAPADGWLLVPVTINLAKVAGVQNILRLTLRAVRDAMLNPADSRPRPIPGYSAPPLPLPLMADREIGPLHEAYIRATWKVTLTRSAVQERKWEVGSAVEFDPGKALVPFAGLELGKFLSAGVRKSRLDKINRELSLLDYDENAAEEDLARLIRQLAARRPLWRDGPEVGIKLVFVFDELDKMDVAQGLKPMIEGLKNLFLQPGAVFILVTSKRFYYDLLKDRAVEDELLNSYFSAVEHVPLLHAAEVRQMLEAWVDTTSIALLIEPPGNPESKLLDQFARFLTYRSFGNPRDIIRELRQMYEWADAYERPYLTDRLGRTPGLQVFAALQEAIELVAAPRGVGPRDGPESEGEVTLVSKRLSGDEARLEQVRRGLYILVEEIINRQTLPLEASALADLHRDNFSLLTIADVRQLASRMGNQLRSLHTALGPEAFASLTPGGPPRPVPLFIFGTQSGGEVVSATNEFYTLTGRQAVLSQPPPAAPQPASRTEAELIADAEGLAAHPGWAERLSAIGIIGQIDPARLTPDLKRFLLGTVAGEGRDPDASHRLAAAERFTPEILFGQPDLDLGALLLDDADERLLSIYLRLLGGAADDASRRRATDAILALLAADRKASPKGFRMRRRSGLPDGAAVDALTVLQSVADRDVVTELLHWLCESVPAEVVQTTALRSLRSLAARHNVSDLADRIIANQTCLRYFTAAPTADVGGSSWSLRVLAGLIPRSVPEAEAFLNELVAASPLEYARKLLLAPEGIDVNRVLAHLWQTAFTPDDGALARTILNVLAGAQAGNRTELRVLGSVRLTPPEFRARLVPYLQRALGELAQRDAFTSEQVARARQALEDLTKTPEAVTPRIASPLGAEALLGRLQGLGPTPRHPRTFRPSSPDFTWRHGLALLGSAALFAFTLFVFKADLPAGANFGQALLSRVLTLLTPAALAYVLWESLDAAREVGLRAADTLLGPSATGSGGLQGSLASDRFSVGDTLRQMLPVIAAMGYYLHQEYVGPLTFWNQALLFVINAAICLLAMYGLRSLD